MYRCEGCGGTFGSFATPGKCPLCGIVASVRCSGCGYTSDANTFISNNDRCPRCGARVMVPGRSGSSVDFEVILGVIAVAVALIILLARAC